MRAFVVIFVVSAIMSATGIAMAGPKPYFVGSQKTKDEIMRGVEDALRCALQYTGDAQISGCAFAMARLNARDGSDTRAYNLGLTFEAWRDLDVDWVADQKPEKPGGVSAAQQHEEQAAARAMYLLYRGSRDALGISETQLLALMTRMTPAGKATTMARLQFWGRQTH